MVKKEKAFIHNIERFSIYLFPGETRAGLQVNEASKNHQLHLRFLLLFTIVIRWIFINPELLQK